MGRNDPCWCGSRKKWKKCHFPVNEPVGNQSIKNEYYNKYEIILKTDEEIEGIRHSANLAAHILNETCKQAKAGVTTNELNAFAHQMHLDAGATPAPLGYGSPPFPKSICTSLNDVICHGIPNDVPLKEGDIMNIDVSCILNGYFGDCSRMVVIGKTSAERQLVVDVAYECLMRSVAILKPGVLVSAIGDVIEEYAHSRECSVVYQFVGHGVGLEFHEGPQISHCRNNMNIPLVPGMTFTIEPMINAGVRDAVIESSNQWVARTADGKASAQWEHQILITENGHEILTPWER
ncbi:MAG: methionyl aminopeptidase [Chlamydiales bacterium]|nr:methionyl aminopeptidase [Chlamydiia bacterium]MCP5507259.1 methionyl aminopeptidase [Chlamydiales bacterium]